MFDGAQTVAVLTGLIGRSSAKRGSEPPSELARDVCLPERLDARRLIDRRKICPPVALWYWPTWAAMLVNLGLIAYLGRLT